MELADQELVRIMDINTMSSFWTCKSFLPDMMKNNHGHIVTISSVSGLWGVNHLADYAASKFALIGFQESLEMELKENGYDGVRSTIVCPSLMDTGYVPGASSRLLPIMTVTKASKRIVEAIQINQERLFLPKSVYFTYFVKSFLPTNAFLHVARMLGINVSMKKYQLNKLE